MARERGQDASIETRLVPSAMTALQAGDEATHNGLLAEAIQGVSEVDAVLLAHFSTSRARAAVEAVVSCPVLTSPDAAVDELKARCQRG